MSVYQIMLLHYHLIVSKTIIFTLRFYWLESKPKQTMSGFDQIIATSQLKILYDTVHSEGIKEDTLIYIRVSMYVTHVHIQVYVFTLSVYYIIHTQIQKICCKSRM